MILPDFRYHRVDHFSEALDLLRQHGSDAMDISIAGAAVYLCCTPDLKKIQDARIALNTVAPKPIRAEEAEKMLIGADISEPLFEEAGRTAAEHAAPRTSFRSTAEYRREMVRVFVRRALVKALERIGTESGGFKDSRVPGFKG